jgi:hypothetical protein
MTKLVSSVGSLRVSLRRNHRWVNQLDFESENAMARTVYWLTPPTKVTFIVSVVLVILALLVRYAHVSIPIVSAHVFETLLIGYLVLLVGNLFRGL